MDGKELINAALKAREKSYCPYSGFSVGAALSRAGDNYAALYQAADEALYDAKKAGRDQFAIAERKERA